MKMNQNFANKAMLVASLTAGVVGFNSMFNEAQADAQKIVVCPGSGVDCKATLVINGNVAKISSQKEKGKGSVEIEEVKK